MLSLNVTLILIYVQMLSFFTLFISAKKSTQKVVMKNEGRKL